MKFCDNGFLCAIMNKICFEMFMKNALDIFKNKPLFIKLKKHQQYFFL